MIFDVMIQEGTNEAGKQIVNVYRVHDRMLSGYLREAQVYGKFIIAVIPLFANRRKDQQYVYENPVGEFSEVKDVDYPVAFLEDTAERNVEKSNRLSDALDDPAGF